MNLNDLREIDFSEIELSNTGDWPLVIKGAATLLLAILVLVGGYFLLTKDTLTELEKVQKEELTLRDTFVAKYRKAINLASYKLQLEEMKETFSALTRQLPDKTQVADLLVEITQAGLGHDSNLTCSNPNRKNRPSFTPNYQSASKSPGNITRSLNLSVTLLRSHASSPCTTCR